MADDKDGREKQAADEERRQRRREVQEALERGDEAEPPEDDLDDALEDLEYPTTTAAVVDAHGDRAVETRDGAHSVEDVLESVDDDETYGSAEEVRDRLRQSANRD